MDKFNKFTKPKYLINHSNIQIKQNPKTLITSENPPPPKEEDNNKTMTIEEENEYKNKIAQLNKDLEKERKKVQKIQNDPNVILKLKKEINTKNKEIKKFAIINTNQRNELEQLSKELDNKLDKMNYKAVTRNIKIESKKINDMKFKKHLTEQEIYENNISSKEKQLKNIMSLMEILQKENEKLKSKLDNAKNTEKKFKLIDGQKEQERQLAILNNDIKQKRLQLNEHSKCVGLKNELLKRISLIKEEITINHEKLTEFQKKYENLENKINLEQNKPKQSNIKPKSKFHRFIAQNLRAENANSEDEMISVPPKISQMFSEKELKAMFIALDRNKIKYEALLRRFNTQNTYVDSLETKHKLDVKQKLNKINELDEQIEFMNVKKGEYNANIQLFKKQINDVQEEKKLYKLKINKINEVLSKKNKINSRKEREIKLLGSQLLKLKKYLKDGELEKIQNEPEIEIQGDEETSEISGQNDEVTDLTEKTGFYENNDNNINNIKLHKNNIIDNNNEDETENDGKERNNIFIDNEEDEGENNEHEEKSNIGENEGDNIVSGDNNEDSNSVENRSITSGDDDD